MKVFEGKCGVSAKVLADSVSPAGVRLTTMEITYPRIILAELNTHRMLSKNSASSRAIPFAKMSEALQGKPVRFGKAQAGMQDAGEYDAVVFGKPFDIDGITNAPALLPEVAWEHAKEDALFWSEAFMEAGFAKQVYNRLTEPFQIMKTVISGTEWANFFWLRNHEAADPTLHELARCMNDARNASTPIALKAGEWHLPYVDRYWYNGDAVYYILDENDHKVELTLEDAIKVSCARCAAVSFRNIDYGVEKSREVYARLVGDQRKHASAFEHCATPMKAEHEGTQEDDWEDVNLPRWPDTWEQGISHMDRDCNLWSGNLRGFIQYRKLIDGENYKEGV